MPSGVRLIATLKPNSDSSGSPERNLRDPSPNDPMKSDLRHARVLSSRRNTHAFTPLSAVGCHTRGNQVILRDLLFERVRRIWERDRAGILNAEDLISIQNHSHAHAGQGIASTG
jgi:hypothetical protein